MNTRTNHIVTRYKVVVVTDVHTCDSNTRRSTDRKDKSTTLNVNGVLNNEIQVGELEVQSKGIQRDVNRGKKDGMGDDGDMGFLAVIANRKGDNLENPKKSEENDLNEKDDLRFQ